MVFAMAVVMSLFFLLLDQGLKLFLDLLRFYLTFSFIITILYKEIKEKDKNYGYIRKNIRD